MITCNNFISFKHYRKNSHIINTHLKTIGSISGIDKKKRSKNQSTIFYKSWWDFDWSFVINFLFNMNQNGTWCCGTWGCIRNLLTSNGIFFKPNKHICFLSRLFHLLSEKNEDTLESWWLISNLWNYLRK